MANPTTPDPRLVYEELLRTIHQARAAGRLRHVVAGIERAYVTSEWLAWLMRLFPGYCSAPFAAHHVEFWEHIWGIAPGVKADPYMTVWARGGAKSTSVELAVAAMAGRRTRNYGLYVSDVQDRADDHVGNVAALLESERFGAMYPDVSARMVGKFGAAKGWRRNRIRTASGFTLDAIGLDTAARGIKIDDQRPDLIVFDDVDDVRDGPSVVERKIRGLTRAILPAQSEDAAIIGCQNLIHADGIFGQIVDGRADFLVNARVSGPIPAIEHLATEPRADGRGHVIVGGTPTWAGMGLERCQHLMDEIGLTAFLVECQHEVERVAGGVFDHLTFRHIARDDVPPLRMTVVAVDPAVTDTDQSDSQAIQVDGIDDNGTVYRLRSYEQRSSPQLVLRQAILWAFEYGAEAVVVETDQGGDTWNSVFREALAGVIAERPEYARAREPRFAPEKAGAGHGPKAHRASQMVPYYEKGRIVHVLGDHDILEKALYRFPRLKPLDLVDAGFWSHRYLTRRGRPAPVATPASGRLPSR